MFKKVAGSGLASNFDSPRLPGLFIDLKTDRRGGVFFFSSCMAVVLRTWSLEGVQCRVTSAIIRNSGPFVRVDLTFYLFLAHISIFWLIPSGYCNSICSEQMEQEKQFENHPSVIQYYFASAHHSQSCAIRMSREFPQ